MGDREYGVDPKTVSAIAREVVEVRRERHRARDRRRRRQLLPRHGRCGRRDGSRHGRLRRHARDAAERARSPGRAREARRADPRAVGDRRLGGRRAVHPEARDAPSREGAGRHLRSRHRQPVLHDGHGRRAEGARDRRRGDPDGEERGGRASTTATRAPTRRRASCPSSPTSRRSSAACASWTRPLSRCAWTTRCRSTSSSSRKGNIVRVASGERIGTIVTTPKEA